MRPRRRARRLLACACVAAAALQAAQAAAPTYLVRDIESEGMSMRLRLTGIDAQAPASPRAGDLVRLEVDVARLADGEPLPNLPIGAWLDRRVSVGSGATPACGERVASILGGGLMQKPLVDLTGYHVLTLDAEGSVSVLDPGTRFAGRSSLLAAVQLGAPGFDWVRTGDDRWLFVALPERREVAVVDLQTYALRQRIAVAGRPTRLALQPGDGVLWIAQRGDDDGTGERIDLHAVDDGRRLGGSVLAPGHHEIAFSEDGRRAFASSRDAGSVAVFAVDGAGARLLREVETGGQPLSLAWLPARGELWVSDGANGMVHRLGGDGAALGRIALERGIGPLRVAPDGRHVLLVNPSQHRVHVLDAATATPLHGLTVSGRPYDVFFSERYAYLRPLDIEQVALLPLASLDDDPRLQYVPVGAQAVSAFPRLPLASTMAANMGGDGAFIAAPGERTVYHFMEGMNAPDNGVRTFGHTPMAVATSRRGLREVARGRYATVFRLPSQGEMVLALAAEAPRMRECLAWTVAPARAAAAGWSVAWLDAPEAPVRAGEPVELRLRLSAPEGADAPDPTRLSARVVSGAGGSVDRWPLQPTATPHEYRVAGMIAERGGYYVHVDGIARAGDDGRGTAMLPAMVLVE